MEKRFRVAELKNDPNHWLLTELGEDGRDGGKALRKPDGTYWEVAAVHIFPPGGGEYRIDIGNQISDRDMVHQLESFYLQAREKIDAGLTDSEK
jgi:hypothetical protein